MKFYLNPQYTFQIFAINQSDTILFKYKNHPRIKQQSSSPIPNPRSSSPLKNPINTTQKSDSENLSKYLIMTHITEKSFLKKFQQFPEP